MDKILLFQIMAWSFFKTNFDGPVVNQLGNFFDQNSELNMDMHDFCFQPGETLTHIVRG